VRVAITVKYGKKQTNWRVMMVVMMMMIIINKYEDDQLYTV
jgi:hypothetical protein